MADFYRIREVDTPQTREVIREVATEVFAYFAAFLKDTYDIVIERGVLKAVKFIADTIEAREIKASEKICIDDVCVTKSQFKDLLEKNGISTPALTPTPEVLPLTSPSESPTPSDSPEPTETPLPSLEPTSSPSETPEPSPEATPEPSPEVTPEPETLGESQPTSTPPPDPDPVSSEVPISGE